MTANRKTQTEGQGGHQNASQSPPTASDVAHAIPLVAASLFYSQRGRQTAARVEYAANVAINAADLSRKLQSPTISQLIEAVPAIAANLSRARREYDVVAKRTQSPMGYPDPQSIPDSLRSTPLATFIEEILLWDARMQTESIHYIDAEAPLLFRRASYTYCTTITKAINRLTSIAQSTRSRLNGERRHIIPFPSRG